MRIALLFGGLLVLLAVLALADAALTGRIEEQAAVELRQAVDQHAGDRPGETAVDLQGWPTAFRLVAGPSPDATVTSEAVPLPDTQGRLTRLRLELPNVRSSVGELLGRSEGLPFSSDEGRFTATIEEDQFNAIVGPPQAIERLEIDDGNVYAVLSDDPRVIFDSLPPHLQTGLAEAEIARLVGRDPRIGFSTDISTGSGTDVVTLRPQVPGSTSVPLAAWLEQVELRVGLGALPGGLTVEEVRFQDERMVAEGRVDVAALADSG